MRKLNGVEVPEWFVINRPPYALSKPEEYVKKYTKTYTIEGSQISLQDVLNVIPKDTDLSFVEIRASVSDDYPYDYEVSLWEYIPNPKYAVDMIEYNRRQDNIKLWQELKDKILIETKE